MTNDHYFFRGRIAYYVRRVPKDFQEFDSRKIIKFSLKTDSPSEARRLSLEEDKKLEEYWFSLAKAGKQHTSDHYKRFEELARQIGVSYKPSEELASGTPGELLERLNIYDQVSDQESLVKVVIGESESKQSTSPNLSEALTIYWGITRHEVMDKSPSQVRKWENARKKAIKTAIGVIGDKALTSLKREDIIEIQSYWIERVKNEMSNPSSANKDFIYLKLVIGEISEHLKLGIDVDWLFRKISLKNRKGSKDQRLPFETEFIRSHILNRENYIGVGDEVKSVIYAMADTGARPSELVGLLPSEIVLDAPIPFVHICPRDGHGLKTTQSERKIPLVGSALHAFEHLPNGFEYHRSALNGVDNLTRKANDLLRSKGLLPSKNHSLYSLRHSFKDRMIAAGVPEQIQKQLMGHQVSGPAYGTGADLELLKFWLEKMCLQIKSPVNNGASV